MFIYIGNYFVKWDMIATGVIAIYENEQQSQFCNLCWQLMRNTGIMQNFALVTLTARFKVKYYNKTSRQGPPRSRPAVSEITISDQVLHLAV